VTSALDAVPGGVITLSDDMRILAANRTMGELVTRSPDELVDAPFDVLLSAPSRILLQTHVYPALKTEGRVEEVLLTLAERSNRTVPVLLNAVRAPGTAAVYVGLIVRVQARARWEADLLAATRELERERAASQRLAEELGAAARDLAARHAEEERDRRFRDAFIGVLSHELRTPITTIYGMSHVLASKYASMDPATLGHHLADIVAESDRLQRLTEDLLVLSRAEGRRLVVPTHPIMLTHAVIAAAKAEQARARDHELRVSAPSGLPLVLGDDGYVQQVLRNYLSNAAKYSPAGTAIEVSLWQEDDGVAVRVIDQGAGLAVERPEQLFELFYRAPEAIRKTSGAGIGLFVCRELAGAMGGRVWAAPATTGGAEFGFWLRRADEESVEPAG
jgi:signal transduction histidine kinase